MRPDSRTPAFEASRLVTPTAIVPNANATKQNASQPKMAIFRCCALQCAIRAERLRDSAMMEPPTPEWRLVVNVVTACNQCRSVRRKRKERLFLSGRSDAHAELSSLMGRLGRTTSTKPQ